MLNKMRSRTFNKVVSIGIAFFFVLTIFLVWGMRISRGVMQSDVIGKVDGEKIKYQDYLNYYKNIYEEAKKQNPNIDEKQTKMLMDQAWERLVQDIVLKKAIKDYKISVTDDEIVNEIMNNPPAYLQNLDQFKTNGKFDKQKYLNALNNPEINWSWLEQSYREYLPKKKLFDLITSMVVVTEDEMWQDYKEKHNKVKVKYVSVSPYNFADSLVNVTDDEISKYYDNHKEDYNTADRVNLEYIKIPHAKGEEVKASHILIKVDKNRTAEDALALANKIYDQLQKGADFKKLAEKYSDDPGSGKRGGELGWFGRGRMVKPFENAAFSLKIGEISKPVKTRFGYHIIKKEGHHAAQSEKEVEKEVKAIYDDLALNDKKWKDVIKKYSDVVSGETNFFTQDRSWIPGIGSADEIKKFAFSHKAGEISNYFNIKNGYYIVRVKEFQKEHILPLEEVKSKIKNKLMLEKKKKLAEKLADEIKTKLAAGDSLGAAIKGHDKLKVSETKMIGLSDYVRGIGSATEFHVQALKGKVGDVIGPVEVYNSYIVGKILKKQEPNTKQFQDDKNKIRDQLIETKKNKVFSDWYSSQKSKIKIEDYRDKFFGTKPKNGENK